MPDRTALSRRTFFGGLAALGYAGTASSRLLAQAAGGQAAAAAVPRPRTSLADYDALAKLSSNENPYGPAESVMQAMTQAFKYANRYGYPDGDVVQAIATHHGVKTENIMLGAGSGEILDVVGSALLAGGGKKVVGVEPSYSSVYSHATTVRGDAIKLPLGQDFRQDMHAILKAVKTHYRDVGFVYLCNPNNPTGVIITRQEIKTLLDGLPEDVPVLVDEAYHHFVDDASYATSVPYVIEGRPVIIARTFSKIAALAGMRLGYAVAPAEYIQKMRPFSTGSINALVKWAGAAAIKDEASQAKVKRVTIELRERTIGELKALGYQSIPSQANFFMVHLRKPVQPVIEEFRKKGVAVGRPFPPLTEHLRVSVGTSDEMARFVAAFKALIVTVT